MAAIWDIYAVDVNGTVVGGCRSQSIPTGTETRGELADGAVYPKIQSIVAQRPRYRWQSVALKAALDAVGISGLAVTGLKLFAQKHAEGGTRAGALSHREYVMNQGVLVPRRLASNHQEDAVIDYEAAAAYDGVNDPVVVNDGITLPADPEDTTRYSLGGATIAGVTIDVKRSVQIDFGQDIATEGGDSDVWDTLSSIRSTQPVITISGIDLEWFKAANVPLAGAHAQHADTTIYFRRRKIGGTFETDASAVHVKITAAGVVHVDDAQDGQTNQPGTVSLRIPCYYDGTNAPLVISTASTIT